MEKMLYRETILLAEEKKRVACTIHYLFKQFDKMIKYQSNDLEKFLNNLKNDNQIVAGDAHNLLKLFSMDKIEEKMSEIATKVKAIIVDKLGVDEKDVTPEASFTNDLGADSLDTVELIMELEKEFDIQIPEAEAEKIATVGDAISFIENAGK